MSEATKGMNEAQREHELAAESGDSSHRGNIRKAIICLAIVLVAYLAYRRFASTR